MRNIILFMHTSLDGFVAGPQGEMDWITVDEEIFDFVAKRVNVTDTALYGRKTYEMMEQYWPTAGDRPDATKHDREHSQWYNRIEKIVLSRTLKGKAFPRTRIISDQITEQLTTIKNTGDGEILLFGSPTAAHELLGKGLIDGFWLFVNPLVLGRGVPLFGNIRERMDLDLKESHKFSSDVVCLSLMRSARTKK
jgi:dihydrofolate reductase